LNAYKRHIAKTITWRLVGTADTILISFILTGNLAVGLKIGATELATKMILYFIHERVWFHLRIFKDNTSRTRHILKTITWRFFGTLDTMLISWYIYGDALIGISIGGLELLSKTLLYYIHERVWYKTRFGLDNQEKIRK
jgi:uncharacterized membrane protein